MSRINTLKLIASLLIPVGLGSIAGLFTSDAVSGWYQSLNTPSFNPPGWIFGPVWTILYILMGVSLFLIWKEKKSKKRNQAITFFIIQQGLNFAWSFIFFYYNLIGIALIEIILLWISILTMIILFLRIKPIAAYINLPYLAWVTFATVLNASFYILN